jgi:hypothetical protein
VGGEGHIAGRGFIGPNLELGDTTAHAAQRVGRVGGHGEFDEAGIEYVRGLLDQGEFQNFFGANLALLQLELTIQSRGWITEHARVLTSNPSDFPSQWNDPEYLAELSFAWLRSNSNAELTELVLRMKDFSLEDIFLELIEEVRIEAENETLFDDLFEDSESVPLINATVQQEISLIQDATEMFGAELAIDDFLSILEAGDFNEYVEKSD